MALARILCGRWLSGVADPLRVLLLDGSALAGLVRERCPLFWIRVYFCDVHLPNVRDSWLRGELLVREEVVQRNPYRLVSSHRFRACVHIYVSEPVSCLLNIPVCHLECSCQKQSLLRDPQKACTLQP